MSDIHELMAIGDTVADQLYERREAPTYAADHPLAGLQVRISAAGMPFVAGHTPGINNHGHLSVAGGASADAAVKAGEKAGHAAAAVGGIMAQPTDVQDTAKLHEHHTAAQAAAAEAAQHAALSPTHVAAQQAAADAAKHAEFTKAALATHHGDKADLFADQATEFKNSAKGYADSKNWTTAATHASIAQAMAKAAKEQQEKAEAVAPGSEGAKTAAKYAKKAEVQAESAKKHVEDAKKAHEEEGVQYAGKTLGAMAQAHLAHDKAKMSTDAAVAKQHAQDATAHAQAAAEHAEKATAGGSAKMAAEKAASLAKSAHEHADALAAHAAQAAAAQAAAANAKPAKAEKAKPRDAATDPFLRDVQAPPSHASETAMRDFKQKLREHPDAPFHLQLLAKGYESGDARLLKAFNDYKNGHEVPAAYMKEARAKTVKPSENLTQGDFKNANDHLDHYRGTTANKNLPAAVDAAASWYTYHGDGHMNRLLRGHDDRDGAAGKQAAADIIPHLDAYTRANRLDHSVMLYRGASLSNAQLAKITKVGSVVKDPAYMSTSTERSIAESFSGSNVGAKTPHRVVMHIEAPKGSHAAFITPHSHFSHESEFLVARGAKMKTLEHWQEGGKHHVRVRLETPATFPKAPKVAGPRVKSTNVLISANSVPV